MYRYTDTSLLDKMVAEGYLYKSDEAFRKVSDAVMKMTAITPDVDINSVKLTEKQKNILDLIAMTGGTLVKEVCYFTGVTPAVVSALEKKGIVELFDSEIYRKPKYDISNKKSSSPVLTDNQNEAYTTLLQKYKSPEGAAALLYGVTGSGKTQVFLKLIEDVVNDGKGVIVMVPEIALTPQTLGIFYSHFGDKVAVFHSALSAGERIDEWKRVKNGEAKIAIGTRSAVFAPFSDLGLIVMDEEQEHTYKSEMSPRYHARDVARFRCAHNKALLVLASATPSIETFTNAVNGRYTLVKLTKRYGKAVLPEVITVDTSGNQGIISNELYNALEECLENNHQAILLMNRRGFNTFASCGACKTVLSCPNCSISLTYHSANKRLMCHYCGYSQSQTDTCPECGEKAVSYSGFGTQRIEDELENIFPSAKILRMDADTTMARYSYQNKLTAFANGEYDIMLGTQMVAKGLDFPRVTLVGIISIDQQLYNDDFRSSERAFDLLTQVIGRSGRGKSKGTAYIQTIVPEHDIIELSAAQDYESFYEREIRLRRLLVFPPFCDIALMTLSGMLETEVLRAATLLAEMLRQKLAQSYADVELVTFGPFEAPVYRVDNKYRMRMVIKCKLTRRTLALFAEILTEFSIKIGRSIHLGIDFNPSGL